MDLARRRKQLAAHAFTLAALAAWAAYASVTPSYQMPGPLTVAVRMAWFFTDAAAFGHLLLSLAHVLAAIAVSFVFGTALALLPHYAPVFRLMVHGRLTPFLNSFSGIGWTLLAIVWFGINDFTVVFAVTAILLPFAIVNMREGLASLDPELIEMGRSFGRSRVRNLFKIVVPALYPFIFATLRISFGVSWKVALTAELFGGNAGLGYLVNVARQEYNTPLIFAVIGLIIAFVYSVNRFVFTPLQDHVARTYAGA
jgi:NitT/TauT family transport system permease protein/sulfonate transport system permease protein